jgi:hypothetical protein
VAQANVIRRTLTDVPPERVPFERSILEADGFTVVEQPQVNGRITLVGTKPDEGDQPAADR